MPEKSFMYKSLTLHILLQKKIWGRKL